MPKSKSVNEVLSDVYQTIMLGAEKVKMESETHVVTGYKVGLVIRLDVKEKTKKEVK